MATKRTYQPKKKHRIKSLGFMARNATKAGRRVLKSRRAKGRVVLTISDEIRRDKNKRLRRRR